MYQVLAYKENDNLGDIFQTIAISRLLPYDLKGVYRDEMNADPNIPFLVNGYLCDMAPNHSIQINTSMAGVYIGAKGIEQARWMHKAKKPIGARDPATEYQLNFMGIETEMCGCASLTFDRYEGKRSGKYTIDSINQPGYTPLTQKCNLPWEESWNEALKRLELLKTAEIVLTNRLHVILPCLAFGTPVKFQPNETGELNQPDRFSILNHMGISTFSNGIDIEKYKLTYRKFLGKLIGQDTITRDPVFPRLK